MQQRHDHPAAAFGFERGGHGPGGLAAAEHLGDLPPDVLEPVGGALAQGVVREQLAPDLNAAAQQFVVPVASAAPIDAATRSATAGVSSASTSRTIGAKIARKASPASSRMISSLPAKYRYGAPTETPASFAMSGIEVWWNPVRAKRRRAAATISARRSARCSSVIRGIGRPPK